MSTTAKYADLTATHIFMPIAIETADSWNQQAIDAIQDIGRRISVITEESLETIHLFQRISFAIQSHKQKQKRKTKKVDGRPSGLVQQGYLHLARTGDGRKNWSHFVKGTLKMQDRKMQDWNLKDNFTGVENAGVENAVHLSCIFRSTYFIPLFHFCPSFSVLHFVMDTTPTGIEPMEQERDRKREREWERETAP